MNEIENLGCNTYGMNLYAGKITPNKNHSVSIFLIVEHTDDKDIIYKEALQMLVAFGKSDFHFTENKNLYGILLLMKLIHN